MSIDHNRPLPVAPERLESVAKMLKERTSTGANVSIADIYTIALLGEQVEQTQQLAFFLSEAYDIFNQRYR